MATENSLDSITAEHFELSDAIHFFLEQNLKKIRSVLTPEVRLNLVVSLQKHKTFTATFQARVKGQDLVARSASKKFHRAVTQARDLLIRQITDRRRRGLASSRRARHILINSNVY